MRMSKLLVLFVYFAVLNAGSADAQSVTGFQPFGSFTNNGAETINLGDLNAHWAIPVTSRNGRIPFSFAITYDTTVYSVVNNTFTLDFEPASGFGWGQSAQAVFGAISFTDVPKSCIDHNNVEWDWDDYTFTAYIDPMGTAHPINFTISDVSYQSPPCNRNDSHPTSGSGISTDGAAYTLSASVNSQGGLSATVTSRDGDVIVPPRDNGAADFGSFKWQDRNGNFITANITFQSGHQITTFTDTLGSVVLTDDLNLNSPQHTYTYIKPGGGNASIVFNYAPYTVQSNFSCTSIAVADFGPLSENLVSSVQLPDGETYSFTYEPTPGYPGNVTGRVASITLPSGGTVSYQYTGTNNGANCSDATIMGYNRTTQDGTIGYSRSGGSGGWLITVSDQQGKTTQYSFNSQYYETQRQYLSGSSALQTINTTYNGGGTFALPITRVTKNVVLPNGLENENDITYNSNGLPTNENDYDWGSGAPGALVRQTSTTFSSLGNNILDKPYQTTVYDGSSNTKSQTTYSYDQTAVTSSGASQLQSVSGSRGNATTIASWVQGSTTVQRTVSYFDTGLVQSSTDFNSNPTSYTYGNCNYSFPTTINQPGSLSESIGWDCNGGVTASSTDVNNQQTTYSYGDPYFWRLTQTADPIGGQVATTYNTSSTPWNTVQTAKITSSQTGSTKTIFDGLGRLQQNQITSDPDGTIYANTTYDLDGNLHSTSNSFRSTSDSTYGVTYYAYDTLGRVTQQTQPDGNTITVSPSSNCTTTTDEASKKREACVDGLGRVTTVYEPDSGNNLTIETDYQYDPLGNLTQVTQKGGSGDSTQWRVRSFLYDGLSRLTSATEPESGTTTYYYTNSSGGVCAGDTNAVCRRTDARGITTTYAYDALNRLTSKTYSDGTPTVAYYYDQSSFNGLTITNGVGRRTGMSDGTGQTAWSYDANGNILVKRQTINGVTASTTYTYNLDGSVATLTTPNGRTYNYSYSNSMRPVSLSDNGNSIPYVQNAHYTASGSLTTMNQGTFGGFNTSNSFNSRLQPLQLSASNPSATVFSLSYNWTLPNGSNNGSVVQIQNNLDNSRSVQYAYDQLNRLISAGTYGSSNWGDSYVYDNWGNLLQKNVTQGTAENLLVTADVQNHLHPTSGNFNYDAAGNMTWDTYNAMNFDAEGQESPVSGGAYYYDGDGHRVEKVAGSSTWYYWFDEASNVLATTGTTVRDYVYFNGQRIAFVDNTNLPYFYLSDHLGSARVIVNGNGSSVQWDTDYYPFGGQRVVTSSLDTPFWFTGYEFDSATGYYYAGFREQSPNLGRFLSPDSLPGDISNPQSWNRYSYVLNNATNLTDPLGLAPGQGKGCGGDPMPCGSAALFGGCPAGGFANGFTIPCAAAFPGAGCEISVDGMTMPCGGLVGPSESYVVCPNHSCDGYGTVWTVTEDGHYLLNVGSTTTSSIAADGTFTVQMEDRWKDAEPQVLMNVIDPFAFAGELDVLYRYVSGPESVARLARLSAGAEKVLKIHGVSTTSVLEEGRAVASATPEAISKSFKIHKTGGPFHYTIELPKPVTQAVADIWNALWGL